MEGVIAALQENQKTSKCIVIKKFVFKDEILFLYLCGIDHEPNNRKVSELCRMCHGSGRVTNSFVYHL